MKRVLLLSAAVAMAALVVAQQTRIELRAILVGNGKGKAVWKTRDSPTQKQAQLQIEAERLVPGADYTVATGGYSWDVVADGFGKIRVSQGYLGANRPDIQIDTPVWVDDANGATVLSGSFK